MNSNPLFENGVVDHYVVDSKFSRHLTGGYVAKGDIKL